MTEKIWKGTVRILEIRAVSFYFREQRARRACLYAYLVTAAAYDIILKYAILIWYSVYSRERKFYDDNILGAYDSLYRNDGRCGMCTVYEK